MIVVDASALGTFLIPDEAGPFADFARHVCATETLHAPAHFPIEIANLLRKARYRKRLSHEEALAGGVAADAIAATMIMAPSLSVENVVRESVALGLSAYDTNYFLLARSLGARVLTDDGALRRVSNAHGLPVALP